MEDPQVKDLEIGRQPDDPGGLNERIYKSPFEQTVVLHSGDSVLLTLKMEDGNRSQETGKGKETDSLLECLEERQPFQHPDLDSFGPLTSRTVRE